MTLLEEFGRSRYVSLTTYRKDGTAVATPVWHVVDGGELFIVSEAGAGKVKRIRNKGDVVVTVCGLRGGIAPDAPSAPRTARLLHEADTAPPPRPLGRRYGLSPIRHQVAPVL